jgi:hypothetical protein
MQALRSVLVRGFSALMVLSVCFVHAGISRSSEGAMITYISATRYIQGNAIPRVDAVGFDDFDVSRFGIVGPTASGLLARTEASQTSRLLPDRIEFFAATRTQFLENPQGNSISAVSSLSVVFSVNEPTGVTLSMGQTFSQSNGGSASAALLDSTNNIIVAATGSPLDPPFQTVVLQPGQYRFVGGSGSGSLQSVAGPAQVIATLTVPATSMGLIASMVVGSGLVRRPTRRNACASRGSETFV